MRFENFLCTAVAMGLGLCTAFDASGQELWKYVDKNGKVTYSDKAPKKDEKAELVKNDPTANVMKSPPKGDEGVSAKSKALDSRVAQRVSLREELQAVLAQARENLDAAKKALEAGSIPTQEELLIVVGRDGKGAPTGKNSLMRKPEFFARIAKLEEDVKKAELAVEEAERRVRVESP